MVAVNLRVNFRIFRSAGIHFLGAIVRKNASRLESQLYIVNVTTVSRIALTTKIQIMGVPIIVLSVWSMEKKFIPKKDLSR